jgi:hypothetical protein
LGNASELGVEVNCANAGKMKRLAAIRRTERKIKLRFIIDIGRTLHVLFRYGLEIQAKADNSWVSANLLRTNDLAAQPCLLSGLNGYQLRGENHPI